MKTCSTSHTCSTLTSQKNMSLITFLGTIIHCTEPFTVNIIDNGFLIVNQSKILAIGNETNLDSSLESFKISKVDLEMIRLTSSQFLIPGFVDTHIHAPQYPNIGLGYDLPLLEWLNKYTYNLEIKYKDVQLSKKVYEAIVRKTLSYGTTTACYYASLFVDSSLILAQSAVNYGQRAFIGKLNMIKYSPDNYVETAEETINNTFVFIDKIANLKSEIVNPIISPRFALNVDMETMEKLAEIAKKYDFNIQTHISENKDEIEQVCSVYGEPYAVVYDKAGLLTNKTVLAHGVHLTDFELELISSRGSSISHCPDSNTRLGSGLCDVLKLQRFGINVALGTDVSGGSSASIIQAMRNALDVSIHLNLMQPEESPRRLNESEVFYMATLGGAKALALDEKIGNFEEGKDFDALIVNMDIDNASADLIFDNYTPLELLHKFIYLGDNRNVERVYVAGKQVK